MRLPAVHRRRASAVVCAGSSISASAAASVPAPSAESTTCTVPPTSVESGGGVYIRPAVVNTGAGTASPSTALIGVPGAQALLAAGPNPAPEVKADHPALPA